MDLEKNATAGTHKYIAEEHWNIRTHVEGMIPQDAREASRQAKRGSSEEAGPPRRRNSRRCSR